MLKVNFKIIIFILLASVLLLSNVAATDSDNETSDVIHNFNQLNKLI